MRYNSPNYYNIYSDIIREKFPLKLHLLDLYFESKSITALDVLRLNQLLFMQSDNKPQRAVFRAYQLEDVKKIIDFQILNNWTNTQTANYYGVSRNSIAKWRKIINTNSIEFFEK